MALKVGQLNTLKFFSHFSDEEISQFLEIGTFNRHSEGDTIFLQGDPGESMYVLLSGQVQILLSEGQHDEVLAILGPGEVFGEGSFATGSRRSAAARASKDTYLYVITAAHLKTLIEKDSKVAAKLCFQLLNIVIERLIITNRRLANS